MQAAGQSVSASVKNREELQQELDVCGKCVKWSMTADLGDESCAMSVNGDACTETLSLLPNASNGVYFTNKDNGR